MKAIIFIILSILELISCQGNSDLGSSEKLFPSMGKTNADFTAANDDVDQKLNAFLEFIYSLNEKGQNGGTTTSDKNMTNDDKKFFNDSLIDTILYYKQIRLNEETTTFDKEEVDKKLKEFLESISFDNEMRQDDSVTSHKDEDEEKLRIFLEEISDDEWLRNDRTTTTVISDEDKEQKLKRVIDFIFPNPNKDGKDSSGTTISVKLDDDKKQIDRPITNSKEIIFICDEDKEQKLKRVIDFIFPNPNKERKDSSSTTISVKLDDDKKQIDRPITNSKEIIFPDDFRYLRIKSQLDEVSSSATTDKFDHQPIHFPQNN